MRKQKKYLKVNLKDNIMRTELDCNGKNSYAMENTSYYKKGIRDEEDINYRR